MYYIYNINTREIVTREAFNGRATAPYRGTKTEMEKQIVAMKKANRKANLVVISLSKATAKGIDIPKIKIRVA